MWILLGQKLESALAPLCPLWKPFSPYMIYRKHKRS